MPDFFQSWDTDAMTTDSAFDDDPTGADLDPDERAAIRAFLQRAEVRLSTMHRIAAGMLSGAGLLVVLPVLVRDSITGILRSLILADFGAQDFLLVLGVVAVLAVPSVALWLLFRDLIRFYFHANHLDTVEGTHFTPRFTLTGLQLPDGELDDSSTRRLWRFRRDPRMIELLVSNNDTARGRIDRQLEVYGGLGEGEGEGDWRRAQGLLDLAASEGRDVLGEVAKVEYGLARHVLRLRGLILRYVKAVLVLLITAVAVYCGDAVVAGVGLRQGTDLTVNLWLAAIVLIWGPAMVVAVTSPVRWIEELMRESMQAQSAVSDDPDVILVERIGLPIGLGGWLAAAIAMLVGVSSAEASESETIIGLAVVVLTAAALVWTARKGRFRAVFASARRRRTDQIPGPH